MIDLGLPPTVVIALDPQLGGAHRQQDREAVIDAGIAIEEDRLHSHHSRSPAACQAPLKAVAVVRAASSAGISRTRWLNGSGVTGPS